MILVAFASQTVFATVRLPLDGYCRPGRYFPIEISGEPPVEFSTDGALATVVSATSNSRVIVPMLVVRSPGDLHWSGGSLPLREPRLDERLVASTSTVIDASDLFPGDRVLPIHLEPAEPLPGPPAAWEALDAIVLDAGAMSRITAGQRSALLAGGVMLATTGKIKPDDQWPWVQRGSFWVLAYTPSGPIDELINPDAYSPTYAWLPGWPKTVRMQIIAAAVLLFLAIVAIALLRNRWAFFGLIALSLGSAGAIAVWQKSFGTVNRASGEVIVESPNLMQRDAWVFDRGRLDDDQTIPWAGSTHPIFGSDSSVTRSKMKLAVAADGSTSYSLHLDRGKTIAFIRREVRPATAPATTNATNSPMRELVNSVYLGTGDHIAGEIPETTEGWPGVLIRKEANR